MERENDFFEEEQMEPAKTTDKHSKALAVVCTSVLVGCILSVLLAATIKLILWMF